MPTINDHAALARKLGDEWTRIVSTSSSGDEELEVHAIITNGKDISYRIAYDGNHVSASLLEGSRDIYLGMAYMYLCLLHKLKSENNSHVNMDEVDQAIEIYSALYKECADTYYNRA